MRNPVILSVGILTVGVWGAAQPTQQPVPSGQEPLARQGASGRRLLPQVDTLRLWYIAWGCQCPPWATPADMKRYKGDEDKLARHTIHIEPATPALELPDHYYASTNRYYVRVAGQFYARRGYPQGEVPDEGMPRARVLRYTWYELEEANSFLPKDDVKLVLRYEARKCVCAQWFYRMDRYEPGKRERIYLEPATAQLPSADKLGAGASRSLRVEVTGQFVTDSGLPKGYTFKSGDSQNAPVFRYRSLKVLPAATKPPRRPKR